MSTFLNFMIYTFVVLGNVVLLVFLFSVGRAIYRGVRDGIRVAQAERRGRALREARLTVRTKMQPRGVPPLICPDHGLEHMCQDDEPQAAEDLAKLQDFEKFLQDRDRNWYRRMAKKLP